MRGPAGLRVKFHLLLLPTVVLTLAVMIAADYRYQYEALMDAHAMSTRSVGGGSSPIGSMLQPDAVAWRTMRSNALFGLALLAILGLAVDAALARLVLRPAARLREQLTRIERGQWQLGAPEQSRDELGALCTAFQRLGPELGALMTNTVNAERLATTALVSRRIASRIEPEVQTIARTIGGTLDSSTRRTDLAEVIAPAAGRIVAALHEFDPVFHATADRAAQRRR